MFFFYATEIFFKLFTHIVVEIFRKTITLFALQYNVKYEKNIFFYATQYGMVLCKFLIKLC